MPKHTYENTPYTKDLQYLNLLISLIFLSIRYSYPLYVQLLSDCEIDTINLKTLAS